MINKLQTGLKKKYAICIVGQFRTFHQKNVYENIYSSIKNLTDKSDIFFVFGENPTRNLDMLCQYFKPCNVSYYDTKKIKPPIQNAKGLPMAVGFKKAFEEIVKKENENGYNYEIIIKLRPDVILGSYFHDELTIDTSKPIVYSEYLGGCRSPNKTDCLNDMSAVITRKALEAYLDTFHNDFYKKNTFTKIQCPECKLGWTLNNNNIYKGVIKFLETIIRTGNNETKEANNKLSIKIPAEVHKN